MPKTTAMHARRPLKAALLLLGLVIFPHSAWPAETVRVRGTVSGFDGSALEVRSREGQIVTITLKPDWMISSVARASIEDIKPGDYIGTASIPKGDGGDTALEVLIFPAAMKGTGEGRFAWDLAPDSMMTNASVANSVKGVEGHTLTLSYKGTERTIVIPEGVPIVTIAPAQKSDIVPGALVFVTSQRDAAGILST